MKQCVQYDWNSIHFTAKSLLPLLQKFLPALEEYILLNKETFGKFIDKLAQLSRREQGIFATCIDAVCALASESREPDFDKFIHQAVHAREKLLREDSRELFVKLLGSYFATKSVIRRHKHDAVVVVYKRGAITEKHPLI